MKPTLDSPSNEEKSRPVSRRAATPAAASSVATPAMQQYLEQKRQVGDALLLFRMGDFYETFYDDAKTVARVLGLTLTARNKNTDDPIPLAGVPYHAVDAYVARLVRAGYKVALSEQLEDPRTARGVVKRGVQRIITPGTLTDETLLDDKSPNYLVALCPAGREWSRGPIGLACVELSSGRFFAEMMRAEALADDLARLRPAEVIVPEQTIDDGSGPAGEWCSVIGATLTPRPAHVFDRHTAESSLYRHFRVSSLAGFGFDAIDASLCAAAAVIDYLQETQKAALTHVLRLLPRRSDRSVVIDQVALRSLEVERTLRDGTREGSLLDAIDMTVNPMGARRLREWVCFPLLDADEIVARQDAIADLLHQPDRLRTLREQLRGMGDVERIVARVGVGRASPRDLAALGATLGTLGAVREVIGQRVLPGGDLLGEIASRLTGLDALAEFLAAALKDDAPAVARDGGFIADGHHAELDRLRNVSLDGRSWLAEFQARESARTGIANLKVGYNSVFGYYIEITNAHRDKAPPDYVRKQTVRNAERYITDELKRHENDVLSAAERAMALELQLLEDIKARATAQLPALQAAADALASLDALAGLAELARRRNYCRPQVVRATPADVDVHGPTANVLEITDGRHPVLDVTLAERFVPNDCTLTPGQNQLLIITGPNMAGKSTYIRQVALLVLLAHTGSFVPARSMRWSPVDRIFARVGANDELNRGHSTFMVEMVETTRILHNATRRSLVILDEIGRGTSTYDGLALAWAITEHIAGRIGCRTLFATHYHELTELADQIDGVANFNVAVHEELRPDGVGRDVVFLHRIVPGPADRSYGVHVAAMAGMPASVIKRSGRILAELERNFHRQAGRDRARAAAASSGPLLPFPDAEPMPAWWRELVDAIGRCDIDRTSPMEALTLLQRLKDIVKRVD